MQIRHQTKGSKSLPKLPNICHQKMATEVPSEYEFEAESSQMYSPRKLVSPKMTSSEFYKNYKQNERITELRKLKGEAQTLSQSLLQQETLPKTLGLLDRKQADSININHMKLGDRYMKTLSNGFSFQPMIKNFLLNDNRISSKSSNDLLKTIRGANTLSLQNNNMGSSYYQMAAFLVHKECKLQSLNLEDNKMSDLAVIELMKRLCDNRTLQILNLSKNRITNQSCGSISQMLSGNDDLKELYLHYNCINGVGGKILFRSNNNLKVLDMSVNVLGTQGGCAQELSKFLEQNQELIHVDLSFNKINYDDSLMIGEALKRNKSLIGFHYAGNNGFIDSKGFLVALERPQTMQSQQQIMMRIRGCNYIKQNRLRSFRDQKLRDCCWICEGWGQIELKWNLGHSGEQTNDPMFIHLSYESFDDLYMGKVQDGLKFHRMLPPGMSYYFFTNGDQQCIAFDQLHKRWPLSLTNVHLVDQYIDVDLHQINYIDVQPNQIIDKYYMPIINVNPRENDLKYIPENISIIHKWTFPISLFKDWRQDNDDLLDRCFLIDWNSSRITKLIKDENDRINSQVLMRNYYPYIKDAYKHYASQSPVGDIWAISAMIFLQILQAVKINEDNSKGSIQQQDLDLKFISTISGTEKGNIRKPERGLIRFQFMELWVRIAEEKYIKKGNAKTFEEALTYLWNDHLQYDFLKYSNQLWRDQRYWNEQCDLCLKYYRPILEAIYDTFSNKKVKPGQKPFMSLQELQDFTLQIGLTQEPTFGSNIPLFAFNKAMMTQTDELYIDRIFQMSFVEFLEAFARIAEDVNPEKIPLHIKIESLIFKSIPLFKGVFPIPDKSYFTPS